MTLTGAPRIDLFVEKTWSIYFPRLIITHNFLYAVVYIWNINLIYFIWIVTERFLLHIIYEMLPW